jgi:hypothetical protein
MSKEESIKSEKEESEESTDSSLVKDPKEKIRFGWLDQFRGLVILLFLISTVTWVMSGNGDLLVGEFPYAPVYYDHGWRVFNSYYSGEQKYDPYPITIIDIGQQILMFLVGFMQAFSYVKRKKKFGEKNARKHLLTRFFGIMFISLVSETSFFGDIGDPEGWLFGFLFEGTLSQIAWGGLFAGFVTSIVSKADTRFYIGLIVVGVHFALYSIVDLRF